MASRKFGTGIQAQIKKELQRSGEITKDKVKQIVFLTLSDAEIQRHQPKTRFRTKNGVINNIVLKYKCRLLVCKWAKALGLKKTPEGGLICENWTPPTTASIEAIKLPV